MARKFKVGDKVKIVRVLGCTPESIGVKIGHCGVVIKYESGEYPYSVKRKNGEHDSFKAVELELIERKGNK